MNNRTSQQVIDRDLRSQSAHQRDLSFVHWVLENPLHKRCWWRTRSRMHAWLQWRWRVAICGLFESSVVPRKHVQIHKLGVWICQLIYLQTITDSKSFKPKNVLLIVVNTPQLHQSVLHLSRPWLPTVSNRCVPHRLMKLEQQLPSGCGIQWSSI